MIEHPASISAPVSRDCKYDISSRQLMSHDNVLTRRRPHDSIRCCNDCAVRGNAVRQYGILTSAGMVPTTETPPRMTCMTYGESLLGVSDCLVDKG